MYLLFGIKSVWRGYLLRVQITNRDGSDRLSSATSIFTLIAALSNSLYIKQRILIDFFNNLEKYLLIIVGISSTDRFRDWCNQ